MCWKYGQQYEPSCLRRYCGCTMALPARSSGECTICIGCLHLLTHPCPCLSRYMQNSMGVEYSGWKAKMQALLAQPGVQYVLVAVHGRVVGVSIITAMHTTCSR